MSLIIPPMECCEDGCTTSDKSPDHCKGCKNEFIPWFEAGVDISSQPDQTGYIEPQAPTQSELLERVAQAIQKIAKAVAEALAPVIRAIAKFFSKLWDRLLKSYAAAVHPKWLHYYKHSKKARVRKKYYNLIRRELIRQLASGTAL